MTDIATRFASLTTPHLADACIRAGVEVRCAPPGMTAAAGTRLAGRVLPTRHSGSVDVFLEALERSAPGDVLVVDNQARADESCVGDLMTLEAAAAGLAGIVIWGLHRDTVELIEIGLPVFSHGSLSVGPQRVDPRKADALDAATVGDWTVTAGDAVFADADGVIFVPLDRMEDVLGHAEHIRDTEGAQADRIRAGVTLREQVGFDRYLAARAENPALTFREHLRTVGGEIEV